MNKVKKHNFTPGKVIKRVRKGKCVKIEMLAEETKISVASLYSIESGRRAPSFKTIEKICIVLNYPIYVLILESINNDIFAKKSALLIKSFIKGEIFEKNSYGI